MESTSEPLSESPGGAAADTPETRRDNAAADPDTPLAPEPHRDADPTVTPAAPAADALVPCFPGQDSGTGLVLYGGADGALHTHWRLEANDLERAGGSFPCPGSRPTPVVRLRRARPDGGADPVDEVNLRAVAREGAGETQFQVAADHGRYHAELGLTNGDGGWLMLARSNALDNVSPVGVDLARLEAVARATPIPSGLPLPAPSLAPPLTTDDQEPTLAPGAPVPLAGQFPLVEPRVSPPWAVAPASAATGPAPWHGPSPPLAPGRDEGLRLVPGSLPQDRDFPLPVASVPAGSNGDGRAPPSLASTLLQPVLEGRPLRLPAPGEPLEGPAESVPLPPVAADLIPAGPDPSDPGPTDTDWTLTYGQAPIRRAGLEVEAQLRITGQAAPGSLVDLFGHPFRVGPGGRFQLLVRVDDPSLLRLALFLHPPPELTRSRDE